MFSFITECNQIKRIKSIYQHKSMLGTLMNTILTFRWSHLDKGHPRSRRKKNSNWKFWVWVLWCMFYTSFLQESENAPISLSELPKSDKNWKPIKKQESPVMVIKVANFYFQNSKFRPFSRYDLEMLFTYTANSVLWHIIMFWKFKSVVLKCDKKLVNYFPTFQNFKYFENPR